MLGNTNSLDIQNEICVMSYLYSMYFIPPEIWPSNHIQMFKWYTMIHIVACWHSSIQLTSLDPDLEGPDFIIRQQIFGKMLTDHKAMVRDSEGALLLFARILHLLEEWIKYSDGLSYCLFLRFSLIYSLTTSLVFNYTEHSGRWCLLQPDKPLLK